MRDGKFFGRDSGAHAERGPQGPGSRIAQQVGLYRDTQLRLDQAAKAQRACAAAGGLRCSPAMSGMRDGASDQQCPTAVGSDE